MGVVVSCQSVDEPDFQRFEFELELCELGGTEFELETVVFEFNEFMVNVRLSIWAMHLEASYHVRCV